MWVILKLVVHACNISTWEAEAGSPVSLRPPELHSEIALKKKKKSQYIDHSTLTLVALFIK